MLPDTLAITKKVHSELMKDAIFSSYIKKFTRGGLDRSMAVFPFVTVNYPSYSEIDTFQTVTGKFRYRFEIYAGAKCLAPGVALIGSESTDRKGIVEITNDISNVVAHNFMDGTFIIPPRNIETYSNYMHNDSDTVIIGRVTFEATVQFFIINSAKITAAITAGKGIPIWV